MRELMTKSAPTRVNQFRRYEREAARELGIRKSDERVQRLAVCRMQRFDIHRAQQLALMSGKLTDPTPLLDADDRLRLEEHRLSAAAAVAGGGFTIAPMVICSECRRELHPTPTDFAPRPERGHGAPAIAAVTGAPTAAGMSDAAVPEKRTTDVLPVTATASKPRPSNVVELDRNRSRDMHAGGYLKQPDISRDANVGAFIADPVQRDPHPVDHTWPMYPNGPPAGQTSEPPK
jgi:hypothetical protein